MGMNILTLLLTFKQIDSYYNYLILNIIYKMCLCDLAQTALGAETVALPFWNGSVHFISVAQSCPTLCDPMNRSTPGLPIHHQLLEFTQTHVHRVRDAIQPSHPLSSPSPPAPNPCQHQGLFQ